MDSSYEEFFGSNEPRCWTNRYTGHEINRM